MWSCGNSFKQVLEYVTDVYGVQDPEVSAAFADVSQNPANIAKYANNPKIQNLLKKMQGKFAGPDDDTDIPDSTDGTSPTSESTKPTPHVPSQPDID